MLRASATVGDCRRDTGGSLQREIKRTADRQPARYATPYKNRLVLLAAVFLQQRAMNGGLRREPPTLRIVPDIAEYFKSSWIREKADRRKELPMRRLSKAGLAVAVFVA